jgi:hypothetical protein
MPEVELNRARILAGVSQIEAGRMAEHVRMDGKLDAGGFSSFRN